MKLWLVQSGILVFILQLSACTDNNVANIKASLVDYTKRNDPNFSSFQIDSITYTLADSSLYYNHRLKFLEEKSESFSRMARLRTDLAQSHMSDFLSADKKDINLAERNKHDVDKSLEALKQNERDWDAINDSMDLMLNAVHTTDTLKKVFYDVHFLLKGIVENKKLVTIKRAVLNKDDYKVVLIDE